jgi:phosphoserine phosphatase
VHAADPLASWRDGPAKSRIVGFVKAVTDKASKEYVAPTDRIAVFDNDGTLWGEQPAYFQLAFAIDRVRALAPSHPQWRDQQPFNAALEGDVKALAAAGEKGLLELVMASHAGTTSDEFAQIVRAWAKTATHPVSKRRYVELTYRPMRELLDYLRANGFRAYIVSGGGIEFLRAIAEELYGVPPEQVIGSSIKTKYEVRNGQPAIVRLPELDFIDDKAGKPVAIHKFIGKRPIAAFGNSDGDFEMLEYVTSGPGRRLGVIVHHDDAAREFAYDRDSHIGRLARGLDEAGKRGWLVVSMKNDWHTVHPAPR